jgi:hypothetical protein
MQAELTHLPGVRLVPRFHLFSVLLHGPGCHWRSRSCDDGFPVNLAPMWNSNSAFSYIQGPSVRQVARPKDNILPPFLPLSRARRRVFIDPPFGFTFSTASENKSAKLYDEEPENLPLHCDVLQLDICHGGIVRGEKGGSGGKKRKVAGS